MNRFAYYAWFWLAKAGTIVLLLSFVTASVIQFGAGLVVNLIAYLKLVEMEKAQRK